MPAREFVNDTFFDKQIPFSSSSDLASWHTLLDQMTAENEQISACSQNESKCTKNLLRVSTIVDKTQGLTQLQRIRLINRYINRYKRYREDQRSSVSINGHEVRVSQQWVTLLDFLKRGGDCEDYATAKYQLLRLAGVPSHSVKVVVVYDKTNRDHHAVVAVQVDKENALLLDTDNRTYPKRPSIYRYVYAINENHIWDYGIEDTRLSGAGRRALNQLGSER